MKRNNDFWLAALFHLEEKKLYYINRISDYKTKKNTKTVLSLHSKTIKRLSDNFKTDIEFNFDNEFEMIRETFQIREKENTEWIFILQESQQRVLSMIEISDFKHAFKRNLKHCIEEGERFNKWIRKHISSAITELRISLAKDIESINDKLKTKDKRTKAAKKLISTISEMKEQRESITDYTECADEAADLVLVLFLKCKEE